MPEPESTDAARGLDKSYISGLIEKDYVGLRRLLTRRTRDYQAAADLLNEAVRITWEKWCAGEIQRPEQVGGYIYRVAINLRRNSSRLLADRPELRESLEQLDHERIAAPSAEAEAEAEKDEQKIAAKLKELIQSMKSQRDRELLVCFYLDEEDKESICRKLRLDARQFDRVLHRARQRLRQLLILDGWKSSDFLSVLL
jgi:RNA polymerase sigma-70 factor, ECF subfamily